MSHVDPRDPATGPAAVDRALLVQEYLLGELGPADLEAFEARLAEDPAWCEAVVEEVRRLAAVADVAPARSAPRVLRLRVHRWVQPVRVAAAATLLIAAATALSLVDRAPRTDRPGADRWAAGATDQERVLALWLAASDDDVDEEGADASLDGADLDDDLADEVPVGAAPARAGAAAADAASEATDDEIPEWLLLGLKERGR